MKIRSITAFIDPGWPLRRSALEAAGEFLASARQAYRQAGYEVQTVRIATPPFPILLGERMEALPELAACLEAAIQANGIAYASLGPALPQQPDSYRAVPAALRVSRSVFFSGIIARNGEVHLPAVQACARIIRAAAPLEPEGFANLRFAALANVPAHTPFFPASYHAGRRMAFAIATEAADLAVQAFGAADSIEAGRQALVAAIQQHARLLTNIARRLPAAFRGVDFSLAPYPEQRRSLGTAFNRLGVRSVGSHGSLAAAAILAEAVDRARFRRTGFSGLMLPVLEDACLARQAAAGALTLKDLLLYSAVCGTGLDTVPLPGGSSRAALAALLLDLAFLSTRLGKPLTARLMPIPGRRAGDPTSFDFDFFANSRVMDLPAGGLGPLLGGAEIVPLRQRNRR